MPLMKPYTIFFPRRPTSSVSALQNCRRQDLSRRTFFKLPQLDSFIPSSNQGEKSHDQTYHARKILPYSQKQLYDLVADVDNYRYFVPYCIESKVLRSWTVDSPQRVEKREARLAVGFLAFKESYVSEVTCRPYLSVEAVASHGTPLFRKLITTWRIQPASPLSPHPVKTGLSSPPLATTTTPEGKDGYSTNGPTLLSIDLAFAFANPLYAAASNAFFKQVSSMMVEAFEKRCIEVYGPGRK